MRLFGFAILACLALALLKAVAVGIMTIIVGGVVVSALVQPVKTFTAGLALITLGLIGQYPVAGAAAIVGVVLMGKLLK